MSANKWLILLVWNSNNWNNFTEETIAILVFQQMRTHFEMKTAKYYVPENDWS